MTYSSGHPVRLIGGRLVLDFLNTADWTDSGDVAHEKIAARRDVRTWLDALGLPEAVVPEDLGELRAFRKRLRRIFCGDREPDAVLLGWSMRGSPATALRKRPILDLIAISALSVLSDPRELERIKSCPGSDCGWLFLDETKNSRRKWCSMETCGNRAKAAKHYKRVTEARNG